MDLRSSLRLLLVAIPTATAACGSSAPTPAATGASPTTTPSTLTTTTPGSVPDSDSGPGLRGRVTAGPTCPVERSGQPCPPDAVHGHINAVDSTGHTAGSTTIDDHGNYAIALLPGLYNVHIDTGGPYPRCPDTPVTIPPGTPQVTDIHCDTGIR